MTDDNVIPWPGTEPAEPGFPISREPRSHQCPHRHVTLHDESHTVVCTACETPLDAWEILHRWTVEWEYLLRRYERIRMDIDTAQTRLDSLLRRERNARARLARVIDKSGAPARALDAAAAFVDARRATGVVYRDETFLALAAAVDGLA